MDERTYWHKQSSEAPLFPDLAWSRPENKHTAGKLLIVGGNLYGFSAPANAYQQAVAAGIGSTKVLLPSALKKTVGRHLETAEFAPSTPSGSFAKSALAEVLELTRWSNGLLLSGDFGRNSETAVLLESVVEKHDGQLTATQDSVDYFYHIPEALLARQNTLLVLSFAQLQKMAAAAKFPRTFTFSMDLLNLISGLNEFSQMYPAVIMVKHLDNIVVAANGQVSTTKLPEERAVWRVAAAARASVWWLQHPTKPFEAITASVMHD